MTAGVLNRGALAETPYDEILNGIRVNYVAPVIAARAGMKYLEETKGQLLLFTSSSYTRGRADYSIYSSAKAAVVNSTQALADEWTPRGIRVNCINPGSPRLRTRAFGAEDPTSLLVTRGGAHVHRRAAEPAHRPRHRRAATRSRARSSVAERTGGPDRRGAHAGRRGRARRELTERGPPHRVVDGAARSVEEDAARL